MAVKVLIGADLVPTESNYEYFRTGNSEKLIGLDLCNILTGADFSIFNLETPLTNKAEPIDKCGPNLIAPIDTIRGLQAINPHFFTLANNHILDQGEQGLFSTIETLNRAGIAYSGVGENLSNAVKPYIVEINNIKLGIYCCVEHEFSIASDKHAGANPFDALESFDHVENLKKNCDYLIVLYHGGKEHYRYPSPELQRVCRKFVEKGANLVVCQHSHCIGAVEMWKERQIIYGQGNFLFDHSESEYWQTGLLLEVFLEKQEEQLVEKIQFYPLKKEKETVRLADKETANQIITELKKRSEEIGDPEKVLENYKHFSLAMLNSYLNAFSGRRSRNMLFRIVNKLSNCFFSKKYINRNYGKRDRIVLQNFIECEAHRELLLAGLKFKK